MIGLIRLILAALPPEAMEPWAGEALMGKERSGVLEEQARGVAEKAKKPRTPEGNKKKPGRGFQVTCLQVVSKE